MYKKLEEKMWSQIAKLDTKLVIFLQGSKAITLSVIFSIKQSSFLPPQEKNSLLPCWTTTMCSLMVFNKLIAKLREL